MIALVERPQTAAEEMANALSHGLGLVLSIASLPVLLAFAARRGSTLSIVGVGVFSVTMILVYLASVLFHALPPGRSKRFCNRLDHVAIYLFIAGSYTPFVLGLLPEGWRWAVLGLVWSLALVGAVLKLTQRLNNLLLSTALYVAMSWLVVAAAAPWVQSISADGLAWLLAGGLSYSVGVVFFLLDSKLLFGHFVWHLFALGGSSCHFCAALWHLN